MALTNADYFSKVGIRDWNPAMIPFGGSRRNGRLSTPETILNGRYALKATDDMQFAAV
jgi:hypothetical protein